MLGLLASSQNGRTARFPQLLAGLGQHQTLESKAAAHVALQGEPIPLTDCGIFLIGLHGLVTDLSDWRTCK